MCHCGGHCSEGTRACIQHAPALGFCCLLLQQHRLLISVLYKHCCRLMASHIQRPAHCHLVLGRWWPSSCKAPDTQDHLGAEASATEHTFPLPEQVHDVMGLEDPLCETSFSSGTYYNMDREVLLSMYVGDFL